MINTLQQEWDKEKNGKFNLTEKQLGSHKKAWWICNKGHNYESAIRNRANGTQCPYCLGRIAITGKNDLTTTHPELIEEWDYEKNTVDPKTIKAGSNTKVWWKCSKNHEWHISPNNRTSQNSQCPYCSNRKVLKNYNDAETIYPQFQQEYDNEKNIHNYDEILLNSKKKFWWICELGHSYESAGEKKVLGQGCPYCINRKLLQGYNDLATRFPQIAEQWDYEKNDKNLTPETILFGSYKKIWWKCSKGHSWITQTFFRTTHIRQSGCPDCSKRVSKGEREVRKFAENILQEKSLNNNRQIISPYELDIYFPKQKIAIEYNGTYWHSDIQIRKTRKTSAEDYHLAKIEKCKELSITLIYVWQDDWENSENSMKEDIKEALLNNKISESLTKLTNGETEGQNV